MDNNSTNNFHNKEIGRTGESIGAKYLQDKGFLILEMNYLRKWGEIDIVSRETSGKVHFVEVKTVSYETKVELNRAVTRRTWSPEENVHKTKLEKLGRAIETWIMDNKFKGEFQIDVLAIRIVPSERYASLKFIPNVVLE